MGDVVTAGPPSRRPRPGLGDSVTIWEVAPRDGLQNEPTIVAAEVKAEFVRRLLQAGLATVEVSSFVRPSRVPQLADAEEVYSLLRSADGPGPDVRLPALVPNRAGLGRALDAGVTDVCVFASATETFAQRNLNTSRDGALDMFEPVVDGARAAG